MSSTVISIPVYIPMVDDSDADWFIPWVVATGRNAVSITVTTYGIPCDLVCTGDTYPLPPDGVCRVDSVTLASPAFTMVFNMRVIGPMGFPASVLRLLGDPSVVKVTNDYEFTYKPEQLF
ncbi:uncharacterized protein SCHCODRAFT_02673268 [Schizophyllum commune H4-8]|uniref:Uncharacterized protein n=1 Tax=Schizophyllum commune (strain H4-8 / FGSC 9210) TaxID=578458 RepID=D8QI31_SCHCM|nr:uncharacterized protein SCHCODRAFT_02672915 [Schizophyllum commune H4-8]XP_050197212.1 uncharacterized protein SCHCODRAFT_02673268 [Schizophyllum commune H4-8]KAI5885496.1 hypothetical protein SCHCODRAFT_02673268 [Schizophyllum commune H4-8]KAI5885837.1 hypothetical protein SCHCODRAFT_02672915 [Schizophyllum commune H4-8]